MNHPNASIVTTTFLLLSTSIVIAGAADESQSTLGTTTSSLLAKAQANPPAPVDGADEPHALRDVSLFAIEEAKPPTFHKHDLIQIVVRETSRAKSKQKLKSEKEYDLKGKISAWPDFSLRDLLDLRIGAGRTTDLPQLGLNFENEFEGKGDYERRDDFTARITAEVIEVLPNGNLVLEARSQIKMDEEVSTMKVTGTCSPDAV
ncbi:MAG: flagellar basal body L-ring protein FlgH, partial [Phycisphaerales bacterium]